MSSKLIDTRDGVVSYSWTPAVTGAAATGANEVDSCEGSNWSAPPLTLDPPKASASETGGNAELEHELRASRARISQLEQEFAQALARIPEEKRVAYQEGVERGESIAAAKWSDAMQRVAKALADLAQQKPRLRREVEGDAVRLALAIARKVLHRELAVDPEAIGGLVRVAFDKVNVRDVLRVRVASADVPFVSARFAGFAIPERIEIIPDPALERGSILLDLNQGQIDASVSTQLDEIERGLTDALDRSGS